MPRKFDAPFREVPLQFAIMFGMVKLEWCGYPMAKKCDYMLAVLTQCWRIGNGQTDRRTDILRRHSLLYAYAEHRAVKIRGLLFGPSCV